MYTNLHNDNDIITGQGQFYENVKGAQGCRILPDPILWFDSQYLKQWSQTARLQGGCLILQGKFI